MIERTHRSHGPRGVQISPRTSKALWLRAVYAATKAAVEAMTGILAKELGGRNITVNAIAPGPTATKLFLDGKPQEVIERLSKLAPLERLGQPQDIADAVAFLAGADGAWINGQTLRANGGILIWSISASHQLLCASLFIAFLVREPTPQTTRADRPAFCRFAQSVLSKGVQGSRYSATDNLAAFDAVRAMKSHQNRLPVSQKYSLLFPC